MILDTSHAGFTASADTTCVYFGALKWKPALCRSGCLLRHHWTILVNPCGGGRNNASHVIVSVRTINLDLLRIQVPLTARRDSAPKLKSSIMSNSATSIVGTKTFEVARGCVIICCMSCHPRPPEARPGVACFSCPLSEEYSFAPFLSSEPSC